MDKIYKIGEIDSQEKGLVDIHKGSARSYLELSRSYILPGDWLLVVFFELPPSSWSYVVSVLWIYLLPGGLTLAVYLPNQLPGGSYLKVGNQSGNIFCHCDDNDNNSNDDIR